MIGIIGTAGRDKTAPLSLVLWERMLEDARERVPKGEWLVSGGAAWADHLAVRLFLEGHVSKLTLHLPAKFKGDKYVGEFGTAGGVSNYYHKRFSLVLRLNSLEEIKEARIRKGYTETAENPMIGYAAMFARNAKIAEDATELIAYTFGSGERPESSGTLDTWKRCKGVRRHVPLSTLL